MPTYVYACTTCDHQFEQYQSFSDDSLTICPECDGRLRKVFNSVGLVFKGSGFYVTDKEGSGATTGRQPAADSSAAGSGDSSGDASGESSSTASGDSSSAASGSASGSASSSESAASGSASSTGSTTEAA